MVDTSCGQLDKSGDEIALGFPIQLHPGKNDFSFQFRKKNITRYRRIGYNSNVMRQSACLVFNQSWLITLLPSFNYTPVGRASDYMMAPT